jgi:hypothetical protein
VLFRSHIINNTLEKKSANLDAQIIGPSLHDLLPELNINDWNLNEFEFHTLITTTKKTCPENKEKKTPVCLIDTNLNWIYKIEKNEYFI